METRSFLSDSAWESAWDSILIGGLLVGLPQGRVLRLGVGRSVSWAVASFLGWTLGGSTVLVNDKLLPRTPGIVGALIHIGVILLGGILLGAVTGLVLPQALGGAPSPAD